jgi:2-amino-4-hydroxy-6-hydroxymethyldihydropteridine diphosphokinase
MATIESALSGLSELGNVTAVSSVYETEPIGYTDQPPYLNAVAEIETTLSPEELLESLLALEANHGRVRTFPNAPRTLDLDLLLYDDERRDTPRLTLPHPRLHERAFVLVPLAEIAAGAVVPGQSATAESLLKRLGTIAGISRFETSPRLAP